MQINSEIKEFKNTGKFSVEEIEKLLACDNKSILRWAIVEITPQKYKVSVVYQQNN